MNCYLSWNLKDMTNISAEKLQKNISQQTSYIQLYRSELTKEAYKFNIGSLLRHVCTERSSFGTEPIQRRATDCLIIFLHAAAFQKVTYFAPTDAENPAVAKCARNLHRLMLENVKSTMRFIDYEVLQKHARGEIDTAGLFPERERIHAEVFPDESLLPVSDNDSLNGEFLKLVEMETRKARTFVDFDVQRNTSIDTGLCQKLAKVPRSETSLPDSRYGLIGSCRSSLETPFIRYGNCYYSFVTAYSLRTISEAVSQFIQEHPATSEPVVEEPVEEEQPAEEPVAEVTEEIIEPEEKPAEDSMALDAVEPVEAVEPVDTAEPIGPVEPAEPEEVEEPPVADEEIIEETEEEPEEEPEPVEEAAAEPVEEPEEDIPFEEPEMTEASDEEEDDQEPEAEETPVEEPVIEQMASDEDAEEEQQDDPFEDDDEADEVEPAKEEENYTALVSPDAYDYLKDSEKEEFKQDPMLEEQDYEDWYDDDDDEEQVTPVADDEPDPYSGESLFSIMDDSDEGETVEEEKQEEPVEPIQSEWFPADDEEVPPPETETTIDNQPEESEEETVEELVEELKEEEPEEEIPEETTEPEPEPEPEPVVEQPAEQPLPLLEQILSFAPSKTNPIVQYLSSCQYEQKKELVRFIEMARKAWLIDGKDKVFSIPDTSISVAVFAQTQDPMLIIQRRENIGAVMYASQKDYWNSLEISYDGSGQMVKADYIRISRNTFSDWEWKVVEKLGTRLLERRGK